MITFDTTFILLLFLNIELFGLIIILLSRKNKIKLFNDEEYIVALKNLEYIVNVYKSSFVSIKVEGMKKTFDLNPDSVTNAMKQFQDKLNIIYSEASKDVFKNFINRNHRDTLLKYFTSDSLILTIITLLKKVET